MSAGGTPPRRYPGERLALARDNASLANVFRRHRRWFRPVLVRKLAELAREKVRVDARASLQLAETAFEIARHIGGGASLAFAQRAKANALWFLNENQASVDLYAQAAALFQELGDETEVGRTLSSSIQPLIRLGEYARAGEAVARARRIFESAGDELRLARLELNAANIWHRQDRFQEAFDAYERAYHRLLVLENAEGIAAAMHNMAVCLVVLNDFHKALDVYNGVREFCREHQMPALAVQADYNIAYLHYLRGDFSRGLEMLRTARLAAETAGDAYHRALCYMDQSEIYLELDMREEAAENAEDAFHGFQSLGIGYESAKSLANLAIARGRMGKVVRSLELFGEARALFVSEGNQVWPSLLDLYQALVLYSAGRFEEAARLGSGALEFFRARKMAGREALCRLLLARTSLPKGDGEAREHCAAALRLLESWEAPHLRQQAWLVLGQVEEHDRQPAAARDCYHRALQDAESLRRVLRGDELKVAFMQGTQEIYQGLVRLYMNPELGDASTEEVFASMEQAKSRSLRELVSEGPLSEQRLSGDSAQHRRAAALKAELNWYYHRIELEQAGEALPSDERVAELEGRAREHEKELAALLRDIPLSEAESAELSNTGPVPLATIREMLGRDTVLVEYFRAGDRLVAAVVTANQLEVAPVGSAARVEELARSLIFQLSKFQLGSEYVAACHSMLLESTRAHLGSLYRELVAPIEGLLRKRKLVFVPHESLHHLPMHALFDGHRYLLDRFAISYAPSASVYALCQERAANASEASLVLGVPDPRAPMILSEIHSVKAILPDAELLVGEHATRHALESKGPGCRILHIATHGLFREDRPMFSSIRLGDGYLTLYDLYQLSLPVDLATLSGCSTGRSVVAGGDELLGLVRGLLHAGARTLLLTLWDVQDRSTALLMKSFYGRLAGGDDKASALRGAMLELRDTHPHPYFWAPFVLIGKA